MIFVNGEATKTTKQNEVLLINIAYPHCFQYVFYVYANLDYLRDDIMSHEVGR